MRQLLRTYLRSGDASDDGRSRKHLLADTAAMSLPILDCLYIDFVGGSWQMHDSHSKDCSEVSQAQYISLPGPRFAC